MQLHLSILQIYFLLLQCLQMEILVIKLDYVMELHTLLVITIILTQPNQVTIKYMH